MKVGDLVHYEYEPFKEEGAGNGIIIYEESQHFIVAFGMYNDNYGWEIADEKYPKKYYGLAGWCVAKNSHDLTLRPHVEIGQSLSYYGEERQVIGRTYQYDLTQYAYMIIGPDPSLRSKVVAITRMICDIYHVDSKYLGAKGCIIAGSFSPVENHQKKVLTGMACANRHCREFNPYAEPNCPGSIYLCYGCRTNAVTYASVIK